MDEITDIIAKAKAEGTDMNVAICDYLRSFMAHIELVLSKSPAMPRFAGVGLENAISRIDMAVASIEEHTMLVDNSDSRAPTKQSGGPNGRH